MNDQQILNLLFFCVIIFSYSACSDDEDQAFKNIPAGTVTMSQDGASWESSIANGISVNGINNYNAINGTHSQLSLTMENNTTGQYLIGGQSLSAVTFSINSTAESYTSFEEDSATGEINIIEVDLVQQTISGSFNAVLVDADGNIKTITNGLFNKIRYN